MLPNSPFFCCAIVEIVDEHTHTLHLSAGWHKSPHRFPNISSLTLPEDQHLLGGSNPRPPAAVVNSDPFRSRQSVQLGGVIWRLLVRLFDQVFFSPPWKP